MAEASRVKISGKWTARGLHPVKPGKVHPLSPLDHAMAAHSLHLVFYYPAAAIGGGAKIGGALRDSISEMIVHFPAVAGRMIREEGGNWAVKFTDTGIRVLDARAAGDLDAWLREASPEMEKELAQRELPGEDVSIWSPFTLQITDFDCGGISIGLSCAHMLADPICATLILKAWSDCHRRICISHPPFFYPPALRTPPNPNPNPNFPSISFLRSKSSPSPQSQRPLTSTTTFRFSDNCLRRCLSELRLPNATPFDALAALFWWRIAAVTAGHRPLTLVRDFRKLMYAPLPHGYFGNALHFASVPADVPGGGWGGAAAAIRAHLEAFDEEEIWAAMELYEKRARAGPFQMYGPELTCVCLDGMFSYDVMFEADGAPCHVACHVGGAEGEGLILVLPGPPEDSGTMGRTVMVTLPEDLTARIREDPVILDLGPTVLFGSS